MLYIFFFGGGKVKLLFVPNSGDGTVNNVLPEKGRRVHSFSSSSNEYFLCMVPFCLRGLPVTIHSLINIGDGSKQRAHIQIVIGMPKPLNCPYCLGEYYMHRSNFLEKCYIGCNEIVLKTLFLFLSPSFKQN